jgi:hypothetical protein
LPESYTSQRSLDLAVFEFSSSFAGQHMLDTPFPFHGEFVRHM